MQHQPLSVQLPEKCSGKRKCLQEPLCSLLAPGCYLHVVYSRLGIPLVSQHRFVRRRHDVVIEIQDYSFLEFLPDEILLCICQFLDFKELCSLSQISKRFSSCACDNALWLNLYRRHFLSSVLPLPTFMSEPAYWKARFGEMYTPRSWRAVHSVATQFAQEYSAARCGRRIIHITTVKEALKKAGILRLFGYEAKCSLCILVTISRSSMMHKYPVGYKKVPVYFLIQQLCESKTHVLGVRIDC